MGGFGRMHEKSRRAGGGHGGGDFAADVAGFAYAHHHHAPMAMQNRLNGLHKSLIQPARHFLQSFGFRAQHLPRPFCILILHCISHVISCRLYSNQ